LKVGGDEMPIKAMTKAAQRARRINSGDLAALVHSDVECRLAGGSVLRGELAGVGADYLTLRRATTGRTMLLQRQAVLAVVEDGAASVALGDGDE
jgi:hypothetical protein